MPAPLIAACVVHNWSGLDGNVIQTSGSAGEDNFDDGTVFLLLLQLRSFDKKTLSAMYEIQANGGWVGRAEVSIRT